MKKRWNYRDQHRKNEEKTERREREREREKNERNVPLFHLLVKKAYHQIPEMLII